MPAPLTNAELKEIEARVAATSGGAWQSIVEGRDQSSGSSFIQTGVAASRAEDIELLGATIADQDFIAAAKQDIPRLIAEIRRLKALPGSK